MSTTSIQDSRYSWIRLIMILAIATLANVGRWAVIVILAADEVKFGAGRAEAARPYTLTMIGFAVSNRII